MNNREGTDWWFDDDVIRRDEKMFSANGVPWPHEEWLYLTGQMTVGQAVELVKRWGKVNGI